MEFREKTDGPGLPRIVAVVACLLVLGLALSGCKKSSTSKPEPPARATPTPGDRATSPTAGGDPAKPALVVSVDAAKLVEEQCTKCHGMSRIKAAEFDAAKWDETVGRMLKKPNGPELDDAQRKAVVAYLTSRYGPAE